ncbi:AAA family ATPase [Silicimonas algicola]|uniref:MoxR-like ATPase n=1 Tax=Silicimonas algicola TaxID=1826607 RepID=A0A316G423_9RHOB|nr:AAA family ATPase [Silicimonas algicola]AZQ69118.1 AAA family ATPase [Silicimonas algicola]PWK55075.1 MoxR-like ATPase [Silicimonas algicola]
MNAVTDASAAGVRDLQALLAARLIGHDRLVERMLIALLTGGHMLVEGAPGLAKTRAVRALADAVSGTNARIQCTPDLMPADLTGTPVWRAQSGTFDFVPGPVFHNLVHVDEINRAPPKVQSALLEAMAEGQVTSGGETRKLPDPFLVVATQNSIEHDGTFPLPEAQLDRFLLHVVLDLPDLETERRILDLVEAETLDGAHPPAPISLDKLTAARNEVRRVHLAPELRDYIVRLVVATRDGALAGDVGHAASPRGSLALAAASRARAWLAGRDYALPEDVADLARDALAHRIVLNWRAVAEGRTAREVVGGILDAVEPL